MAEAAFKDFYKAHLEWALFLNDTAISAGGVARLKMQRWNLRRGTAGFSTPQSNSTGYSGIKAYSGIDAGKPKVFQYKDTAKHTKPSGKITPEFMPRNRRFFGEGAEQL